MQKATSYKNNIVGVGVLMITPDDTFLFQERDTNTERNPGMITPFGGGLKTGESAMQCAIREMDEELGLVLSHTDLQNVGIFESHYSPGTFLQIFLVTNISVNKLSIGEGKAIKEMSAEEATDHPKVTDFTKEVLLSDEFKKYSAASHL